MRVTFLALFPTSCCSSKLPAVLFPKGGKKGEKRGGGNVQKASKKKKAYECQRTVTTPPPYLWCVILRFFFLQVRIFLLDVCDTLQFVLIELSETCQLLLYQ